MVAKTKFLASLLIFLCLVTVDSLFAMEDEACLSGHTRDDDFSLDDSSTYTPLKPEIHGLFLDALSEGPRKILFSPDMMLYKKETEKLRKTIIRKKAVTSTAVDHFYKCPVCDYGYRKERSTIADLLIHFQNFHAWELSALPVPFHFSEYGGNAVFLYSVEVKPAK